jgi:membrane associated rhomboid family serine protease
VTLTNLLIAVNVIVFAWQYATGNGLQPGHNAGVLDGPDVMNGEWWRLVTGGFMHGSIPHIALNMLALLQVGTIVETMFGKLRFAMLYAVALLGSALCVVTFNYDVYTLGASGAIFGLFGALVAVGVREGSRGRALIGQVLPVILINLVFTVSVPGISIAAHVGGLITGFIAGLVLYMMPRRRAAYAYAVAANDPNAVETIEQPPHAGPHEDPDAPPLHVRDPEQ